MAGATSLRPFPSPICLHVHPPLNNGLNLGFQNLVQSYGTYVCLHCALQTNREQLFFPSFSPAAYRVSVRSHTIPIDFVSLSLSRRHRIRDWTPSPLRRSTLVAPNSTLTRQLFGVNLSFEIEKYVFSNRNAPRIQGETQRFFFFFFVFIFSTWKSW